MSEFIAVIGRFYPIGDARPTGNAERVTERCAALLMPDGQPWCQTVRLERIVPEPSVSAEQAADEFLRLTDKRK